MKVTSVEHQKKNPKRFNIFLDGQFVFGADEDLIVGYRLLPGKEIDSPTLEKLLFEAEVGKLMERLYRLLGVRGRSEREVRDYLKRLSFKRKAKGEEELSEMVIESVLMRLRQKRLVDDLEFAKAWVEARQASKKKGLIALKAELFQKGIDRAIIEQIMADETTVVSQELLAEQALERKLKSWSKLDRLVFKKKALDFLMRRGFEYEVAKDVVEKFLTNQYNSSSLEV